MLFDMPSRRDLSPREALALIEAQRAARREATARYRERQAAVGVTLVQVRVPNAAAARLVRQVGAALRSANPRELATVAEQVAAYDPNAIWLGLDEEEN